MSNTEAAISSFDSSLDRMEQELRVKLSEYQLKAVRDELAQVQQTLYETQRNWDEDKRALALMKSQFDVLMAATNRWEEERARDRCRQMQQNLNSEAIHKERDSLLNQTKNLCLENMGLRQRIQELEMLTANKEPNDETLAKLKNKVSIFIGQIESELPNLRTDVETLQKSTEAANQLNGRLQAAGMCASAMQRRQQERIKELENELKLLRRTHNLI